MPHTHLFYRFFKSWYIEKIFLKFSWKDSAASCLHDLYNLHFLILHTHNFFQIKIFIRSYKVKASFLPNFPTCIPTFCQNTLILCLLAKSIYFLVLNVLAPWRSKSSLSPNMHSPPYIIYHRFNSILQLIGSFKFKIRLDHQFRGFISNQLFSMSISIEL
jgi:hypothetical protein